MRIIHLSDIHLSKKWQDATERTVMELSKLIKEQTEIAPIDFIVISGDLIDKGGSSYGNTSDALKAFDEVVLIPLIKAANIDRNRVVICPGNHEVEGSKVDKDSEDKFKTYNPKLEKSGVAYVYYNEFKGNTEFGNKLRSRVESYENYRNSFIDGSVPSQMGPLEYSVKFDIGKHKVGFTSLNSIWRCDEKGVGDPFVLGHPQINESKDFVKECDLKIALMHNHPAMLHNFERTDINNLLSLKYDILLVGHSHYGEEGEIKPPGGDKIAFLQSPGLIVYNAGDRHEFVNGVRIIDYDFSTGSIEVTNYVQGIDESFRQDRNYINEGVWRYQVKEQQSILPVSLSLLKQQSHSSAFIPAPIFHTIIDDLRNNDKKEILLIALTGLGKTRLLYEAFNPENGYKEKDTCFYCTNSSIKEKVLNQSEFLMSNHPEGCTIILDNCPIRVYNAVVKLRNDINPNVKIIGVNNDLKEAHESEQAYLKIPLDGVRRAVEGYVNASIDDSGQNPTIKHEIIKIADGFPMMAVNLVEKFKNGENVGIHDADELVRQILGTDLDEDEMQLMMLVALFNRFPTTDGAMNLLMGSQNLSRLHEKGTLAKTNIINRVKNKFAGTLLEISDASWEVRPYPLAIRLASRWFETFGSIEVYESLLEEIQRMPNPPKQRIIESMARRLEKMDDSFAAQELISLLTKDDAVFNSEKAVSSEVGSRLFLAMSTVNPSSVAACLNTVISRQSDDWIQSLDTKARRNIVGALTKLVFDKASFDQAIRSLIRLAENETDISIRNNSIDLFTQIFRIVLPGTEVSLRVRAHYIKEFAASEWISKKLLLKTLAVAYSFGSAVRFGGSSFGTKVKKDYEINDREELEYFWDICNAIALSLLDKGIGIEEFTAIVRNNLFRWAMGGVLDLVKPFAERVFEINGFALNLSKVDLDKIKSRITGFGRHDLVEWLSRMEVLLIPNTFVSKLVDVTKRFHQEKRFSAEDFFSTRDGYFSGISEEFLNQGIFKNTQEIQELLCEKDTYSIYFAPVLAKLITEEQTFEFLRTLTCVFFEDASLMDCPFVSYFVPAISRRFDIKEFMAFIKDKSLESYIGLLSRCEDPELAILSRLTEELGRDKLGYFLPIYLYRCNRYAGQSTTRLLKFLNDNFEEAPYDIANFLIRNFTFFDNQETEQMTLIREMLMKYDINDDMMSTQYEYWRFVIHMLEEDYNSDFAVWVNKRIIDNTESLDSSYGRRDFYEFMIPEHIEDIWVDLSDALFKKNPLFYYAVKDELGSGFSFGRGILFQINDELLKQAIADNPAIAPHRMAGMCPVFKEKSPAEKCSFSEWGMYLINTYPSKEVLDAFGANAGTYQWSGSVVPLLQNKINAFSDLIHHENSLVRNWAAANIKVLEEEQKTARIEDDMNRMYYEW